MKKNKAFTLVELVIATGILTVSVFGIYKLISENNKVINNSKITYDSYLLFPSVQACIENMNITETSNIYFWEDLKQCLNEDKPTIINNIEYHIKAIKKDDKEWEIEIKSDYNWTLTWSYIKNIE